MVTLLGGAVTAGAMYKDDIDDWIKGVLKKDEKEASDSVAEPIPSVAVPAPIEPVSDTSGASGTVIAPSGAVVENKSSSLGWKIAGAAALGVVGLAAAAVVVQKSSSK